MECDRQGKETASGRSLPRHLGTGNPRPRSHRDNIYTAGATTFPYGTVVAPGMFRVSGPIRDAKTDQAWLTTNRPRRRFCQGA